MRRETHVPIANWASTYPRMATSNQFTVSPAQSPQVALHAGIADATGGWDHASVIMAVLVTDIHSCHSQGPRQRDWMPATRAGMTDRLVVRAARLSGGLPK